MNINKKLMNIQMELKAPKGQYNSFGKYKYRSCEDILEAVKPLLEKNNCTLTINDTLEYIGDRYYIKATAVLMDIEDDEQIITNCGYAREELEKKGMDGSQITGTASSYARKYALNGLFLIDDTKDADTDEYKLKQEAEKIITQAQVKALQTSINNNKIDESIVNMIITQYGYNKLEEIKIKDYMQIVEDLKGNIKGE